MIYKIKQLFQRFPTLWQFIKFSVVGVLNTLVDFAVLNLLMWLTNIYKGSWMILLNAISFTCAVLNSYLWNKYWTFGEKSKEKIAQEFSKFFLISVVGIILNTAIVYSVTTYIPPFFGLSAEPWANLAKVLATIISMCWNFIGYKFWAFKR